MQTCKQALPRLFQIFPVLIADLPEKPELEGEDRPRDGTDGEQESRRADPAAGHPVVELVTGAQGEPLGEHEHEGEPDADGGVDDLGAEGDAHQGTRGDDVIHAPFLCARLLPESLAPACSNTMPGRERGHVP